MKVVVFLSGEHIQRGFWNVAARSEGHQQLSWGHTVQCTILTGTQWYPNKQQNQTQYLKLQWHLFCCTFFLFPFPQDNRKTTISRMQIRTLPLATRLLLRPKAVRNSLEEDSGLKQMNQLFISEMKISPHWKCFFMYMRWGSWQSCHDLKTTRITRTNSSPAYMLTSMLLKREMGEEVSKVQTGYSVRLCWVTLPENGTRLAWNIRDRRGWWAYAKDWRNPITLTWRTVTHLTCRE